ncbi:MAG TPA: class I SAM-dependent methyltransferase [Acidimicrobiia bacterium]|nr:class I SAM-dependent methyltransferase [Acidimicrobiia bacterium]
MVPTRDGRAYDTLAGAYDWLVPDALLTPEGSAATFAPWLETLPPGSRVLDCAAGTGQLAVGLALAGFDVVATDASPAMIARTKALAAGHGTPLRAETCAWDELGDHDWGPPFAAVLCVGNSLTHAPGRPARRAALAAMASVLTGGGLLVVTSRNWELVRERAGGVEVADRLVERGGRRALVVHAWTIGDGWGDAHGLDVAVAVLGDDGSVETHREGLRFWPFRHEDLDEDLRAAGFDPAATTYTADAERYLVTAVRRP